MTTIINLTPHAINVVREDGITTFAPSGQVARCEMRQLEMEPITVVMGGVEVKLPLKSTSYGKVEGLPQEEWGTMYIVSALVRTACPDRFDLLSPGDPVRDSEGRVVGCKSLICG